jgi:hypothetical protein
LVLVRNVGAPLQLELGAVVDGGAPIIVRNEDVIRLSSIDESEFKGLASLGKNVSVRARPWGGFAAEIVEVLTADKEEPPPMR